MNQAVVDQIVRAVLYEGYNLYPYRPSVKNQYRWTFGGVYPRSYSDAQAGADAWHMQAQCLVRGDAATALDVNARFLHLRWRRVGRFTEPLRQWTGDRWPAYELVESIQLGRTRHQTWQEAVERNVATGPLPLGDLVAAPQCVSFSLPAEHESEPLCDLEGQIVGVILRDQEPVNGALEISAERLGERVFKVTLRVVNRSSFDNARRASRDEALMRSLLSTHAVLSLQGGQFVSLMDPPEPLRAAAADCRNTGVWPVLIGAPGETDAMLASPIILYDYPQIAPESPGDLFDGTEIDELLSLRIITLTDEERQEAAAVDERTRLMLQRTELLAREQLAGLHGAIRSGPPADVPNWDPFEKQAALRSVRVGGVSLEPGDRVRLRPGPGADILDLALEGRVATIETIEQDYENRVYLAVTVDDDPGNDFGRQRQPGHRFFFKPEEVELLEKEARSR